MIFVDTDVLYSVLVQTKFSKSAQEIILMPSDQATSATVLSELVYVSFRKLCKERYGTETSPLRPRWFDRLWWNGPPHFRRAAIHSSRASMKFLRASSTAMAGGPTPSYHSFAGIAPISSEVDLRCEHIKELRGDSRKDIN